MKKRSIIGAILIALLCAASLFFFSYEKAEAAKDKYVIKVNKKMNTVTVYRNNIPIKAMVCSVGKTGNTPTGTFSTSQKMRWHTLYGEKKGTYVYGQYATRFKGHFLFHSVCYSKYKKPNTLKVAEYRKLGTAASKGCIRLTVEDAKWLYDNCPLKTKVIVYNSSNPGPLGKPKAPTIPKTNKSGWDPTDPSKSNPYYKKRPTISIASKKASVIYVGSTFKPLEGVTAKSYKNKSLTSRIKVIGKVDTKKAGRYLLTYQVQDTEGNYRSREFEVTVKLRKTPEFIGYKKELTLGLSQSYTCFSLSAKDKDGTDIYGRIKVSCPDGTVKRVKKEIRFYQPGVHNVTFSVTGLSRNGSVKVTKKSIVTVLDNYVPVIELSNPDIVLAAGEKYGPAEILEGVKASTKWKDYSDRIAYTINGETVEAIDTAVAGTYVIEYNVSSDGGAAAEAVRRTVIVE